MKEETNKMDTTIWFSTYGVLTARRILEQFGIQLDDDQLIPAVKNPYSLYYQLLRVPLKNVFNGIILQQIHDYQAYAQKLLIDYLMSGETEKSEDSPGGDTRENLEAQRVELMSLGDNFEQIKKEHQKLIAESQTTFIQIARDLQTALQGISKKINQLLRNFHINREDALIFKSLDMALVHYEQLDAADLNANSSFWKKMAEVLDLEFSEDMLQGLIDALSTFQDPRADLKTTLSPYLERVDGVEVALCNCRAQFYQIIITITELIQLLPDYHADEAKLLKNKVALQFDSHIGERTAG